MPKHRRHWLGAFAVSALALIGSSSAVALPGEVSNETLIEATASAFGGELGLASWYGESITPMGDLDGDGIIDLAVGAPQDDAGGHMQGAVWLLFMNADLTVKSARKLAIGQNGLDISAPASRHFGASLAVPGDLDGDGIPELAVGAESSGRVFVLFLNSDGTVRSSTQIDGPVGTSIRFGCALAAMGDLDGDGLGDLAVGAPTDNDGGDNQGALWLLYLNADGTTKLRRKISETAGGFTGELALGDMFAGALANLGDLDGDGVADLAVGAQGMNLGASDAGAVWVLLLATDGTVKSHVTIGNGSGGFSDTLLLGDFFGNDVTRLGDIDGDGVADLAVGTRHFNYFTGELWILTLNADGTVKGQLKITEGAGGFIGVPGEEDDIGYAVAALGDVTGDGVSELATPKLAGDLWIFELDAEPANCGNDVLDPLEECEDGGTVSGDGCFETCEREDSRPLTGTASGGSVEITIDGVVVTVNTQPGQTAVQVIDALAAAVVGDPTLAARGTVAVRVASRIVSNGRINALVLLDAGLTEGPGVPVAGRWLHLLLVGLLVTAARAHNIRRGADAARAG